MGLSLRPVLWDAHMTVVRGGGLHKPHQGQRKSPTPEVDVRLLSPNSRGREELTYAGFWAPQPADPWATYGTSSGVGGDTVLMKRSAWLTDSAYSLPPSMCSRGQDPLPRRIRSDRLPPRASSKNETTTACAVASCGPDWTGLEKAGTADTSANIM